MALGADARAVLRIVLGQGAMRVALGLLLGVLLSIAGGRFLAASLIDVAPSDTATVGLATLLLFGVGNSATLIPARRAARTDPAETLKAE
jgi:ABC-type antimicrobial peptide transport system permease subunit